jgi:hypothetical protein
MLDQPLLVRFRDSGCIVGFSASRGKVMGVAPNDQLDLIADTASVDTASTILFWAQEWAEFRSRQVSLR